MNNVICAIAKNENLYINDWVNWHLNLGFDKIYLYDNNDITTPFVGDFIEQIDKIKIIDVRGMHEQSFQIKCYNEFYNSHEFDWCAFIDIDEFIILNKWKNIQEFVSDPIFKDAQVIKLNWHLYGDDDLIERDMTLPIYQGITKWINHSYNSHGKEIIRGGLQGLKIESTHWSTVNGNLSYQIMPDGRQTFGKVHSHKNCNEAWVNHYITKTLSEYVNQKLYRGDACILNRNLGMQYYWDVNRKTPEKLQWLKENGYD